MKRDTWTIWFVIGFIGAIVFWGWVADVLGSHPVNQPVSLKSMPRGTYTTVCTWGEHPVSVIRVEGGQGLNNYDVTCSNGDVVGTSW